MNEPLTDAFIQATGKALLDMNKRIEALEEFMVDTSEWHEELRKVGE